MSPALLFLLACLPLRILLAFLAKTQLSLLTPMGIMYLFIGVGMAMIYLFNLRPTGIEAGGRIWWNSIRPLHSAIYLGFSAAALTGKPWAWLFLLADVIVGVIAFLSKNLLI
jgi:hypothetical protein